MATIPLTFATGNWYTLKFIASRLGKSLRTVQYWHQRGLFAKMGLSVIVIHTKLAASRGITWVQIPNNRTYAMFKSLPLTSLPPSKLSLQSNERSIQGS